MAIPPGQRLGPYEILSAIGAGGMGEVYRARDTRLDRTVAIKILPGHLADRPNLRERFEREAKTIASLNHPHICTLYDVGHQEGTDYLVMEYLQGETLAQRLTNGPLPLKQVLQYAIEVADALDKAHRKGITHRDLKPGNIIVTKSGTKLLDFGLAKLQQEAVSPSSSLSTLPTASDPFTAEGTILGTLNYMAPEQVEGRTEEIDARTDIFAFGVVVYEMVTGRKAFEGKSQASIIGAILKDDPPPMSSLQPMTPPALDRVVKRCLAKDREDRWQTARDVCEELKWISSSGSQAVAGTGKSSGRGTPALGRRALILALGMLLVGAAVASLATWSMKPESPRPVTRTVITLPTGQQLAGLENGLALALSPDGTQLAYVARQGGIQQIYLREMDSLEAKAIPGTEGGVSPFFSPDGQWVGFFSDATIKKVAVNGGAVLDVGTVSAPLGAGASWGNQRIIAFARTSAAPIQQVPEAGGAAQSLTHLEEGDVSHRLPEFLPGDKAVLFAAARSGITFGNAQVAAQFIGSGERRNLVQGGTNPRYSLSGHLVYAQGGGLMAAPFDPQRLTLRGAAVKVVDGVLQSPTTGTAQYSISATGSLVYVPGGARTAQSKLVWVSRNGSEQPLAVPARPYRFPHLSPNGRQLAVTITEQESQTWLYDLARETLTRFTFGGTQNYNPIWTPDGKRIAFESNSSGPINIFWQLADGSGGLERLTTTTNVNAPFSWSPDGQLLAFVEIISSKGQNIQILRIHDRKTLPLHETQFNEQEPRFSPDGRWLAYISDESGRNEVFVQPYPGPGGKWQISADGGTEPVWNPNGRELYFRNGDRMMAVEVNTQPSFSAGTPRTLFEGRYESAPVPLYNFDISPDGQRFLMVKSSEQEQVAPTQINVVQNWFEELKQKVPTGKK